MGLHRVLALDGVYDAISQPYIGVLFARLAASTYEEFGAPVKQAQGSAGLFRFLHLDDVLPSTRRPATRRAAWSCRSKIGFCMVSCIFLEFMRFGRTRLLDGARQVCPRSVSSWEAGRVTDFTSEDLTVSRFEDVYLTGARFHDVDPTNARFQLVDVTGVMIRGAALVNVDISGDIKNLRVNGVDVVPLVEAELNRQWGGEMQLDLMGHDPKPALRWPGRLRDYGRHTDRTRYSYGGTWRNSRQRLFRWLGIGSL